MNCMKWREETQETCPLIAHNLLSHSGGRGNEGKELRKSLGNGDPLDSAPRERLELPQNWKVDWIGARLE